VAVLLTLAAAPIDRDNSCSNSSPGMSTSRKRLKPAQLQHLACILGTAITLSCQKGLATRLVARQKIFGGGVRWGVGVMMEAAKGGTNTPSICQAQAIAGQVTHHTPQRIDAGQHGEQLASFLVCQRRATWPGCLGFAASHLSDVAFQQEATVVDKAQPTTDGPRSVITNLGRQFVTQRHQRGDCLLHHGVNFGERHRRLRFGLGIDCDRSAFGLREMCAQLVAGSPAFIGDQGVMHARLGFTSGVAPPYSHQWRATSSSARCSR
jgi:hypothetical protein